MAERERRIVDRKVEARAAEGQPVKLIGYAAVFNQEAIIAGFFREKINPGAFADAISRPDDVRAAFNHEPNLVLGRTTAGTLRLVEDSTGLLYEIDPPETSYANDLMVSVKRGDVSQSSFMFEVTGEKWTYPAASTGLLPLREINAVILYDVSPVTYPAYEGTSVSARAMALKDAPPATPVPPLDHGAALLLEQLALDEVEG